MLKRNLVILRGGDKSLHADWLGPVGRERSWDMVVSYFGDDPAMHQRPDVLRIDGKGPKWLGLHALLTSGQIDWQRYERIWLPDDDLAGAEALRVRLRGLRDAEDDVRSLVEVIARDDRRARFDVGRIREERRLAGALLHEDLQPGRRQLAERFGYQGDAPLSGRGLLGDADLHWHHLVGGIAIRAKG